eukprot:scaffold1326_cov296-Prasinococcus_capsulatus_cf.AAC.8
MRADDEGFVRWAALAPGRWLRSTIRRSARRPRPRPVRVSRGACAHQRPPAARLPGAAAKMAHQRALVRLAADARLVASSGCASVARPPPLALPRQ